MVNTIGGFATELADMLTSVSAEERKSEFRAEMSAAEHRKAVIRMKHEVPIWEKTNLTLEEAAAYCGIGVTKLRELSDDSKCGFVLWNGTKRLLKRKKLDEYLEREYSI